MGGASPPAVGVKRVVDSARADCIWPVAFLLGVAGPYGRPSTAGPLGRAVITTLPLTLKLPLVNVYSLQRVGKVVNWLVRVVFGWLACPLD